MPQYTILVIHDGKPGHISQAVGLANVVASQVYDNDANIVLQKVGLRTNLFVHIARMFCGARSIMINQLASRVFYFKNAPTCLKTDKVVSSKALSPQLVISFGGKVLALNAYLSTIFQVPNLVIGKTYSVDPSVFSLILKRSVKKQQDNKVGTGITLCRIKQQEVDMVGVNMAKEFCLNDEEYWTMLVGGNGSGYKYVEEDWSALIELMKWYADKYGIKWLLTTSRRTLPEVERQIRKHISINTELVRKSILFHQGDRASILGLLGAASTVFVTEDSLTMVNEAVALSKPVVTVYPKVIDRKKNHYKAIKYLQKQKLIQRVSFSSPELLKPFEPRLSYDQHIQILGSRLNRILSLYRDASPSLNKDRLTPIRS